MMKLVIAGSRSIIDFEYVSFTMEHFKLNPSEIVSGTSDGPDKLGELWAKKHNVAIKKYKAQWHKYGKSAGMIRNKIMADYCDSALILWDGESKGTKNMISNMKKYCSPEMHYIKQPIYIEIYCFHKNTITRLF